MPYNRQRKAAKQVMQNLGDGMTPLSFSLVNLPHA